MEDCQKGEMEKKCQPTHFPYVRLLEKEVIQSENIYLKAIKSVSMVLFIFVIHSTKKLLSKFFLFALF